MAGEIGNELLKQTSENIEAMLAGQKALGEQLKQAREESEARGAELKAKILAHDETLKDQEKWIGEVERKAAATRFGGASGVGETDAVRNLLSDRFKAQIEMVKGFPFGSPSLRKLAEVDPIRIVGSAAFFGSRIKAFAAHQKGDYAAAGKYHELADKLAEALGGYHKAALQEDTAAEGGFLIPTVTEADIGRVIKDNSVVRQAGPTVIQMSTKTHQLPTLASDFSVAIIAEEGTISDAAPATPFGQGTLTAKKFAGLVTLSEELVADSAVNLMDFIMTHLAEMIGRAQDTQALEGDGTGANFTGLFAAAGVNAVAGGSNALSEDELRKLIFGGEHGSTVMGDAIFCHPWIVRDAMGLVVSGGAIWFPFVLNSPSPATQANIWGIPTYKSTAISRVRGGGTNETTAYHGNPKAIVFGDRAGMTFSLDPYTKLDTAQIRMRVMTRTGILVWVPAMFTKLTAVTVAA